MWIPGTAIPSFRDESKAAPEPLKQQNKYKENTKLMDFIVRHNTLTWRFLIN